MVGSEHDKGKAGVGGRLQAVDVLRGAAALAVLFCHIKHHSESSRLDWKYFVTIPLDFGDLGVPLFIVISGFCIHLGVAKRMGRGEGIRSDWGRFWARRVHRLYPPYLAAIVLGLITYGMTASGVLAPWQKITLLPWDLASHLLMVHNLSPMYWAGVGNFPLWTLGMEEQLYALYFLYLLLRRKLTLAFVLLVVLVVSTSWILAMKFLLPERIGASPIVLGQWGMWPLFFWFNWVLGAVAAEAFAGAVKLPQWCYRGRLALALGVFGILIGPGILGRVGASHLLASLAGRGPLQFLLDLAATLAPIPIALAIFLMLNCWVRSEVEGRFRGWWTPWLARVGLFSYSLYLTHVPVLNMAESILHLDDTLPSIALRYVLFTPLCLVFAMGFFRLIERRFLTYHPRQAPQATIPHGAPGASETQGPSAQAL